MSSAPSVPGVEVGVPWLGGCRVKLTGLAGRKMVINTLNCGAKLLMADFEDEPMPVARIVQVLDGPIRDASAGHRFADAPDGSRHAGLAQHPDGRCGPLALFTKEYVHARRLPAGL